MKFDKYSENNDDDLFFISQKKTSLSIGCKKFAIGATIEAEKLFCIFYVIIKSSFCRPKGGLDRLA